MKVLVTGASGFLGQFLCEALRADKHEVVEVHSKNANLTQAGSLDFLNSDRFDHIYHLAAWTQAGDFCLTHSGEQWLINQRIHTHVLQWWHERQPQAKMIAIGTSCAYDPQRPLKEENYLKGDPIEGLFVYAMTKRMLYIGMQSLAKQFGHSYLQFVPSTLYGPRYHTDGRQMHFIFDLIRKILNGKKKGESVVLWGDGYQKRELVHVRDFVQVMLSFSFSSHQNDLLNVGSGEEFSIREFAQLICEEVGYDFSKIQFDTTRYVGAKSKCLEVTKLKSLSSHSFIALREGLRGTIRWFEETFFPEPHVSLKQ